MRNYIATTIFILSSIACFAQSDVNYFAWVYDSASDMPIEGATVTIQCNEVQVSTNKTDLDGEARFDGVLVPENGYTISVTMNGYKSTQYSFFMPEVSSRAFTGAEFYLNKN